MSAECNTIAIKLYGDSDRCFVMRKQFVGRDRRDSTAFLLFMTGNDKGGKLYVG